MERRQAYIRVAGVSYKQEAVRESNLGDPILLVKEPDNPHDPKAIKVLNNALSPAQQVGYIPRDRTVVFHLLMDSGALEGVKIETMGEAKDSGIVGIMLRADYDHDTLQEFIANRPGGSPAATSDVRNRD